MILIGHTCCRQPTDELPLQRCFSNRKSRNKIMKIKGKHFWFWNGHWNQQLHADIGPVLTSNIPNSLLTCDNTFSGNQEEFNFTAVGVNEITRLSNNISGNISTGIDGVPSRFWNWLLKLCIDLDLVAEWMRTNKLNLNTTKTKYVLSCSRHALKDNTNFTLSMQGFKLERVDYMKYLGVILDSHLSFD